MMELREYAMPPPLRRNVTLQCAQDIFLGL
jgi:hypothetical protein